MNNVPNMLALKRQLLQDVIVLNQHPSMLQVVVVCFNFIVFPFFPLFPSFSYMDIINITMIPTGVVPKSMGPPPRDPIPTWATPASRRTTEDVSFHYRGFTGEFEFRVPRGEASLMAQRVIQNDQAIQMHSLQVQEHQCQLGILQAQNQFHQLGIISQFANLTHAGNQTGWIPGLHLTFPNSSGQIATSVTPALTDRVTTSERPSKRFRSENVLEPPRSERGPDPLDKSGTIPSQLGTFVHQWGTQNFQSDVAPEVSAETQTKSVCFKIGRQPEKFISSSVLQIMEFKHPQLEHLGHHLWVSHPLARFSSNQFDAIRHGTLKELDWCGLYSTVLRLHSDLYQNPHRIAGGFEMGRLIEEPRQQKWIPDMHHFCRANGYQTFDEAKRMSGFWYEYVIHDLRTCFPSAFMNSRAAHVEEGIQILIASLMQYPANSILIEEFQILMSSTQTPLAILASVQPPYFRSTPKVQFNHRFLFGHNTQALALCDIVREGFIRPSSCDPADKSWLPPTSFYCRAVVPNHDDFHKSDMERLVKMCGKYGGALSDRPVCILGEAFSRQEHIRTPQGGVMADHMITMVADSAHGADQRWAFRSHLSKIKYVAVILHESKLK